MITVTTMIGRREIFGSGFVNVLKGENQRTDDCKAEQHNEAAEPKFVWGLRCKEFKLDFRRCGIGNVVTGGKDS